jgi:threonine/homoserine/homoserine lactone efflux protein
MLQQDPSASGIAGLVLSAAVLMGSPGPSTMSVTAVGAAFGLRRALPYAAGLIAGTVVVLLAVAAGLVAMLLAVPRLAPLLTLAAAAYIIYLAVRIARAPPLSARDGVATAPSFLGGLLLAAANPKAYVAIAAVLAGAAPTAAPVLKIAILAGMIVLIHLGWLLGGAALSRALRDPVRSRIANVTFAVLLVASSVAAVLR